MAQQQEGSMPQQQQGMAVAEQTLLLNAMALAIAMPRREQALYRSCRWKKALSWL
ncbi:hypothetical protein OsI_18733 [Oryza sativa Indica Group]|uniref:Uncharacterized protein n=2 Tax=Oryza sativa TaxID=4530 RepID=B9FI90_ORYSJ|nr:hypothetical protein OsI_18733 [Oryza sativa Indica Group]EEE62572.1 hypothetical protein OsJ_17371 [Oryza sativa Japonica Group]